MTHHRQSWTPAEIETMVEHYVTAALWSSTGDDGRDLDDDYSGDDIAPDTMAKIREDVSAFYQGNRPLLTAHTTPEQAGHDFWLTRNGHGTGFWDRGYKGTGGKRARARFDAAMTRLSDDARVWGESTLAVGDDGKIHGDV